MNKLAIAAMTLSIGLMAGCEEPAVPGEAVAPEPAEPVAAVAEQMTGDLYIGAEDATVTLVQYVSPTCRGCLQWHKDVWPELKARYVDTGQMRLAVRELPTAHPRIDRAVMALGRCLGPDRYEALLDWSYENQHRLIMAEQQDVVDRLVDEVATRFAFSEEAKSACIADPATAGRFDAAEADVAAIEASLPPVFVLNGRKLGDRGLGPMSAALDRSLERLRQAASTGQ